MLVVVVSECGGGAWKRSRAILDAYLERAGERTWRGSLTEEGLATLRSELAACASRKTAVAASRVVGRKRFELEWIVGSTRFFNDSGACRTYAGHAYDRYLGRPSPAERPAYFAWLADVLALAGLWHDVGKANEDFQAKLWKGEIKADRVRHEILSCRAFVETMRLLMKEKSGDLSGIDGAAVLAVFDQVAAAPMDFMRPASGKGPAPIEDIAPADLPDALRAVAWLVATHHRLLDTLPREDCSPLESGVWRLSAHINEKTFDRGIRIQLDRRIVLQSLAERTAHLLNRIGAHQPGPIDWRTIAGYGRLSLILADRHVSRLSFDEKYHGGQPIEIGNLIANTSCDEERRANQTLIEHLEKVSIDAPIGLSDVFDFMGNASALESAGLPRALRGRSSGRFAWQSQVADAVKEGHRADAGFFCLLMAGTGAGKTRACPKILAAAGEQLRYTLCNPLRTLTLQNGTKYREDLGLSKSEVAVIIGSSAVETLYQERVEAPGSESTQPPLLGLQLDLDLEAGDDEENSEKEIWSLLRSYLARMPQGIKRHLKQDRTAIRLLGAPVVISTVDQLMAAADQRRTSFIMAALRLASADLVLDEIDNYGEEDLVAIGRLVYMAGVFGRKAVLASATLSPEIGRALFDAYRAGFLANGGSSGERGKIDVCFAAEAGEVVRLVAGEEEGAFEAADSHFRGALVACLRESPVLRRVAVLPEREGVREAFADVLEASFRIHAERASRDQRNRQSCSAILVRFSHVRSAVAFARWLAEAWPEWGEEKATALKAIVHHSAFPLLARDEIEKFLDDALKRKPDNFLKNTTISRWMRSSGMKDHMLLVISTAVEEVGRDHDFDGAVIEVSSVASLIQALGRIERHRLRETQFPNVYLMPTSMRRLLQGENCRRAFSRPGVEMSESEKLRGASFRLKSPLVRDLLDPAFLEKVTAIPRIGAEGGGAMGTLERQKAETFLSTGGYFSLAGFIAPATKAYLASNHAAVMRFRNSEPDVAVWFDPTGAGVFKLCDDRDRPIGRTLRVDDELGLGSLRLLDLDPAAILARRYPDLNVQDVDRYERFCRRFLRAGIPEHHFDQGTELHYANDLGIFEEIDI